jgi:hypothetical protein
LLLLILSKQFTTRWLDVARSDGERSPLPAAVICLGQDVLAVQCAHERQNQRAIVSAASMPMTSATMNGITPPSQISVDGQSGNDFAVVSGVPKVLRETGRDTLAVVSDGQTFHLSHCDRFLLLVCHWTYRIIRTSVAKVQPRT